MDNQTNSPNQENNTPPLDTKKPYMLILAIIILLISSASLIVGLININTKPDTSQASGVDNRPEVLITYDYVITPQFTGYGKFKRGDLLTKPENPTYENHIFNAGHYLASNGNATTIEVPIKNPRFNPIYDPNKNYEFIDWYTDANFTRKWNFAEDRIFRDTTLYAKWNEKA